MKTVEEIRRANLVTLIAEAGNAAKLSAITGIAAPYISQVVRAVMHSSGTKPRTIGPDQARRFEAQMGKPRGWMDTDHTALQAVSELNGREGQLVGLFRLLGDAEQSELVNDLTKRLRRGSDTPSDGTGPGLRH